MSLFQFGFTVKETVNSQNSAAHSQPANAGAYAFLPEQEARNTMKLYYRWETL